MGAVTDTLLLCYIKGCRLSTPDLVKHLVKRPEPTLCHPQQWLSVQQNIEALNLPCEANCATLEVQPHQMTML